MAKTIKNWSEDEQPRERLMQKGASALTDAELLTILIGSGTTKKSALDLAREVLALAGDNLRELGRVSVTELQTINGIGDARAITICAAMELGRRRQVSEGLERKKINSPKEALNIVMPILQDLNYEACWVLYMNYAGLILKHEILSMGGMTGTVVDARMILKNCLLINASKIIIAHNHPSGSKMPSDSDKLLTAKLREGAALLDILLLDHLIIAGHEFLSMADEGYV